VWFIANLNNSSLTSCYKDVEIVFKSILINLSLVYLCAVVDTSNISSDPEYFTNLIEKAAVEALTKATIFLPPDVKNALRNAYENEVSESSKAQLKAILTNLEVAEKLRKPICQDTGLIIFYVKVGYEFPAIRVIEKALVNAVKKATVKIPLRPNTVNPITGKNPGNNIGRYVPFIHWEFVEGDSLEFTVVPKGGGSEAVSILEFPPPGEGLRAVKKVVIDAVLKAGAKPCPPTIVGIGIGGGADIAAILAKKAAALRPLGTENPDPNIAKLERELYEAINDLEIGAMGLGGKFTVLGVHIEYAHRHPATYPIAIAFQCWAARRASALIKSNGTYKVYQ